MWWQDSTEKSDIPVGQERRFSEQKEVPVGQTVDNAIGWGKDLFAKVQKFDNDVNGFLNIMDMLGETYRNGKFCRCDSKYTKNPDKDPSAPPICHTDCAFSQTAICPSTGVPPHICKDGSKKCKCPEDDGGGSSSGGSSSSGGGEGSGGENETSQTTAEDEEPIYYCSCNFIPCAGNPCQYVLDLLRSLTISYNEVRKDYVDLWAFFLTERRTDILKELTYSREKVNQCSVERNNYGKDTRLLSCIRVEDEIAPPVNSIKTIIGNQTYYGLCYGQKLGSLLNKKYSDNWFCAEQYSKELLNQK